MLSYMIPVEEKPPLVPKTDHHNFQLALTHHNGSHLPKNNGESNTITTIATTTTTTTVSNNSYYKVTTQVLSSTSSTNNINGSATPIISKETSISSFISDTTTATASHSSITPTSTSTSLGKPKIPVNGGKHPSLKRVSFGSSKGSMVETLIFETPLQEETEPSPIPENGTIPFDTTDGCDKEDERERVRVTFFQQSKPLEVDLPNDPPSFCDQEFIMSSPVLKNDTNHVPYRTESNENGWDNPFRPGGALSQEADQIVELIKGGKPITPTPGSQAPPLPISELPIHQNHTGGDDVDSVSPRKTATSSSSGNPTANQSALTTNGTFEKNPSQGSVDIQRITVKPEGDAGQVEHVTIKKKNKCQCCVIS